MPQLCSRTCMCTSASTWHAENRPRFLNLPKPPGTYKPTCAVMSMRVLMLHAFACDPHAPAVNLHVCCCCCLPATLWCCAAALTAAGTDITCRKSSLGSLHERRLSLDALLPLPLAAASTNLFLATRQLQLLAAAFAASATAVPALHAALPSAKAAATNLSLRLLGCCLRC